MWNLVFHFQFGDTADYVLPFVTNAEAIQLQGFYTCKHDDLFHITFAQQTVVLHNVIRYIQCIVIVPYIVHGHSGFQYFLLSVAVYSLS